MEYRTVYQGGKGEIVEKKSRFIAEVFLVHSEEEAMQYLEQIRKKYWDARHHCWAYVIGEERVTERCSDDGEPSGTAGKPILEVIRGAGLHNIFVVVTGSRWTPCAVWISWPPSGLRTPPQCSCCRMPCWTGSLMANRAVKSARRASRLFTA